MNARASTGSGNRLKRICGICGLGFLVVIVLSLLVERSVVPGELVAAFLVLCAGAIYLLIGMLAGTRRLAEYLIAGRDTSAVFAGVASAAEWAGPAIVLSAAGSLFVAAHDGHALVLALSAGYVLAAVLITPFLRNMSAFSLPDFIGMRFGNLARLLAVIVLVACVAPLAIALLQTAAHLIVRGVGLDFQIALYAVAALMVVCVIPGGMRGMTEMQTAQYVVLVIGALALFLIVEAEKLEVPTGSSYDPLIQGLLALAHGMGLSPSLNPRSIPFSLSVAINNIELVLCLMIGTASLPHILTRPMATASTEQARSTAAWSLLFIAVLVLTLPTYFALAADDAARERAGVLHGLIAIIGLTAMLAAASGVTLTIANSLTHDIGHKILAPKAASGARLILARFMLVAVAALVAYGAATLPPEPPSMTAWAFSLAAAGFFPVLVMGIWWQRTSTVAAVCGMAAGFGIALFYLAVSRYFPQAGVVHFGMSSLLDPASGRPLVDVSQTLADPAWLTDVPASSTNPLASKVGWLDVDNIACGVFGVPVGFLVIIVLSMIGRRPPPARQAVIAALRTPAKAQTERGAA